MEQTLNGIRPIIPSLTCCFSATELLVHDDWDKDLPCVQTQIGGGQAKADWRSGNKFLTFRPRRLQSHVGWIAVWTGLEESPWELWSLEPKSLPYMGD